MKLHLMMKLLFILYLSNQVESKLIELTNEEIANEEARAKQSLRFLVEDENSQITAQKLQDVLEKYFSFSSDSSSLADLLF